MTNHATTPPNASESGYRVFVLASNYRCRAAIAEAAQRLILHNAGRFPKETKPIHPGGSISVTRCETPAAELALVLNKVTELMHARPKNIQPRSGTDSDNAHWLRRLVRHSD
jgi:superfamily I DNA/RNA helicase